MNIVKSGNRYQVYGNDITTYDNIPAGTYNVCFQKLTGFYLEQRTDLLVKEEKIYGPYQSKVDKVLNGFSAANRNFGVILSGKKGVGKTLFTRILAERATDLGYPMLVCSGYINGLEHFLSSIEQEVIVLFDEFEKTFSKIENFDPQEAMLSLFDGVDNGKKLFIITCNNTNKLNDYYLNRPGRFHYHFKLRLPNADEIEEYLTDKILPKYQDVIPQIVSASFYGDITYDCLRAISTDINMGYSLQETFEDLNMLSSRNNKYECIVTCRNGTIFRDIKDIDLTDGHSLTLEFRRAMLKDEEFWFAPEIDLKDYKINLNNKVITVDSNKIKWRTDVDCCYNLKYSEAKEFIDKTYIVDKVELKPYDTSLSRNYHTIIGAV